MGFSVYCTYEENVFDFIIETSKSYGADFVTADIKRNLNYGIPIRRFDEKSMSFKPKGKVPQRLTGTFVGINKELGVPLSEFEHPENAIYMIGGNKPEHRDIETENAIYVKIETPVNKSLWNFIALGLVLDDRNKKQSVLAN